MSKSVNAYMWRIRRSNTIYATTIRNEPKPLNLVHEILQHIFGNVEQLGLDQTLNYPEAVPVVCGLQ